VSWFESESEQVAHELQELHTQYRHLVHRLEAYAEAAPYPHVTERLQVLVRVEEDNARAIAERLAVLGRHPLDDGDGHVRGGRNSWERLVALLEEYRALARRLSALWVRWDDEQPEDAALVRTLRDSASRHREEVVDLVARSDPHALD
jgi:hypothetical protein